MIRTKRFIELIEDKGFKVVRNAIDYETDCFEVMNELGGVLGIVSVGVPYHFTVGNRLKEEYTGVELFIIDKIIRYAMTDLKRRDL